MSEKEKILIVEDEKAIAKFLSIELQQSGYLPAIERNGKRAYERIIQEKYDLVLLDVMLPEMDGMEVCRRVREISDVPIIMLTARDDVKDKVEGLHGGADDYVTKPFETEELLARIQGILKRRREIPRPEENCYVVGNVLIYPDRYEVRVKGERVDLTQREFELLCYLVQNKPNVLSRDQILERVWEYDYPGGTNVVDVYISYLRTKIDDKYGEKHIHTIRGVGYAYRD